MYKVIGVVAVAFVLLAGVASASFVVQALGDPLCTDVNGSDPWTQDFIAMQTDPHGYMFDYVQVFIGPIDVSVNPTSGTQFDIIAPHTHTYNTVGWGPGRFDSPLLVAAWGADRHNQTFTLDFTGAPGDNLISHSLQFTVEAYNDGNWVATMFGEYYQTPKPSPQPPANTWIFTDGWQTGPPPTPEPLSMVMLGCLGAGMMGARKLRRRK